MSPLVEGMQWVLGLLLIASAGLWVLAAAAGALLALLCWIIGKK